MIRESSIKAHNTGHHEEAILLCKIKGKVKIDVLRKKGLAKPTEPHAVDMLCGARALGSLAGRQSSGQSEQGRAMASHAMAWQAGQQIWAVTASLSYNTGYGQRYQESRDSGITVKLYLKYF